jgi:phosphoribosyl 1,2-cyclic phosphate phosphodiesterase
MFLGTAASEGFPDAFCGCVNCESARREGGASLRKRSAALIDGLLLIDLGPDLMAAALAHDISLAGIHWCLQTHEHEDHLEPRNLTWRSQYSGVTGNPTLHYYASIGALSKVVSRLGARAANGLTDATVQANLNIETHVIAPFQHFTVGPYRVASVRGNHANEELIANLFVIERDGRTLFYATDTGEIGEETWTALKRGGHRFDVVAMDHTFGFQARVRGHMNAEQFAEQIARMRAEGLLNDGARVFAHHVAHHSHPSHRELSAWTAARGYEVAYDGLTLDV